MIKGILFTWIWLVSGVSPGQVWPAQRREVRTDLGRSADELEAAEDCVSHGSLSTPVPHPTTTQLKWEDYTSVYEEVEHDFTNHMTKDSVLEIPDTLSQW